MEEINKLNEIVTSFLGERNQTVITPLGKGISMIHTKVVAAEGEYVYNASIIISSGTWSNCSRIFRG